MAQCPVILAADIDRGASLPRSAGRWRCLRSRSAPGEKVIINKFRGDIALLYSGIEQIEALTGVPVRGVLPWLEVDLEDEDSVALQKGKYSEHREARDRHRGRSASHTLKLHRFQRAGGAAGCPRAYMRHSASWRRPIWLSCPAVKNTLGDLLWLRDSGMAAGVLQARQQGIPLLGICGGYQMLGENDCR